MKTKTLPNALRACLLLLLGGLMVWAQPAAAQTGEDAYRFSRRMPATGARMTGLAGAGAAGVADYTAMLSNPAGLGLFNKSMLTGALNTFSTLDESIYNAASFSNPLDDDIRNTGLANLAYIYKVPTSQGSLVVGAAFNQVNLFDRSLAFRGQNANNSITDFFMPLPGEFSIEVKPGEDRVPGTDDDEFFVDFTRDLSLIAYETFGIDLAPDRYDAGEPVPFLPAVTAGTVEQMGRVTEEGAMRELNFGGAVEAVRGIMVGLSANMSFGRYQYNQALEEEDFQNANDGEFGTTDFDYLRYVERFESSLTGFNVRAGFSSELAPGLRAGLTLETPTWYQVDENYSTLLTTRFDNGDVYTYGDEPGENAGSGTFEYRITSPWRLGAGLAFSTAGFTVLGDVEFVDWTQMELDASVDGTYFDEVNLGIRDGYEAVVNYRTGVEYSLGNLALRGGFAYQPDPRDNNSLTGETNIDRARTFFSAGFGYRFAEQLEVDFGWMQERFEDRFLPYADVANGPAPVVDEDVVRNRFVVGVRFSF